MIKPPPRDFPEDADWAVTRSVNAQIRWEDAIWNWNGNSWVLTEPAPLSDQVVENASLMYRVAYLRSTLREIALVTRCDPGTAHYGPECVSCIVTTALEHDRVVAHGGV